jgi:hypothetical protein
LTPSSPSSSTFFPPPLSAFRATQPSTCTCSVPATADVRRLPAPNCADLYSATAQISRPHPTSLQFIPPTRAQDTPQPPQLLLNEHHHPSSWESQISLLLVTYKIFLHWVRCCFCRRMLSRCNMPLRATTECHAMGAPPGTMLVGLQLQRQDSASSCGSNLILTSRRSSPWAPLSSRPPSRRRLVASSSLLRRTVRVGRELARAL